MTKPNTTPRPCDRCGNSYVRTRQHNSPYCSRLCMFMVKVQTDENGCWIWTGATDGHGYGQLNPGGGIPIKAYRWAFENIGGRTIGSGMVLDHLCRVRICVNPEHLEQVTNKENCLRGEAPSVILHRTNRCSRGHPFDEENTIIRSNYRGGTSRTCRKCENDRQRRYYREGTRS